MAQKLTRAERRARSRVARICNKPMPTGNPVGIGRIFGAYAEMIVSDWRRRMRDMRAPGF